MYFDMQVALRHAPVEAELGDEKRPRGCETVFNLIPAPQRRVVSRARQNVSFCLRVRKNRKFVLSVLEVIVRDHQRTRVDLSECFKRD